MEGQRIYPTKPIDWEYDEAEHWIYACFLQGEKYLDFGKLKERLAEKVRFSFAAQSDPWLKDIFPPSTFYLLREMAKNPNPIIQKMRRLGRLDIVVYESQNQMEGPRIYLPKSIDPKCNEVEHWIYGCFLQGERYLEFGKLKERLNESVRICLAAQTDPCLKDIFPPSTCRLLQKIAKNPDPIIRKMANLGRLDIAVYVKSF